MAILLYDLAGAEEDRRFSPFCWRVKMALTHKGLNFEEIPWRFTETDRLSFSGQARVPVLVDGPGAQKDQEGKFGTEAKVVSDSWAIAQYLDEAYPEAPLIPKGSEAITFFFKSWVEQIILPGIAKQVVFDVWRHLNEDDQAYFRTSREKRFGITLEEIDAKAETALPAFKKSLDPMRATLSHHSYLSAPHSAENTPGFLDHLAFGCFAWARGISEKVLLEKEDPVYAWRERMLDAYGGYARAKTGYDLG